MALLCVCVWGGGGVPYTVSLTPMPLIMWGHHPCMHEGVQHRVALLQLLPLLLPCRLVGNLAVHPFLASTAVGNPAVQPPSLDPVPAHPPIPKPSFIPLFPLASLGSSGVLPSEEGGVGDTDTRNRDL